MSYWTDENRLNLKFSLPVSEQEFGFCALNHVILAAGSKKWSKMRHYEGQYKKVAGDSKWTLNCRCSYYAHLKRSLINTR